MKQHKPRLLLLNPPAAKPVFRDCYCSGPSKSTLYTHPLDLQLQSGYFSAEEFSLEFLDAVFEKINTAQTLERIKSFSPNVILSLIGDSFLQEDTAFISGLKSVFPKIRLYLSGDVARFDPLRTFDTTPQVDGILMDFASPGLFKHLRGEETPDVLSTSSAPSANETSKGFEYPLPYPGFVKKYKYQLPFFRHPNYYSIATSFGCPYSCVYCNTNMLGYRTRNIGDFVKELHFASKLGFKSLYIRDATFLHDRHRTLELLKAWKKTGLRFQWMCFTRPDLIDEELAEGVARMGCCLMMLGVESYDEMYLQNLSRNIRTKDMKRAFRILRKFRIRTAAQIIIGMHNDECENHDNASDYEQKLKRFLKAIDPDYISLNIFLPRPGIESENPTLKRLVSNTNINETMAGRINRYFYLCRLKTIVKQMSFIRSPAQLLCIVKSAANLLRNGERHTEHKFLKY